MASVGSHQRDPALPWPCHHGVFKLQFGELQSILGPFVIQLMMFVQWCAYLSQRGCMKTVTMTKRSLMEKFMQHHGGKYAHKSKGWNLLLVSIYWYLLGGFQLHGRRAASAFLALTFFLEWGWPLTTFLVPEKRSPTKFLDISTDRKPHSRIILKNRDRAKSEFRKVVLTHCNISLQHRLAVKLHCNLFDINFHFID